MVLFVLEKVRLITPWQLLVGQNVLRHSLNMVAKFMQLTPGQSVWVYFGPNFFLINFTGSPLYEEFLGKICHSLYSLYCLYLYTIVSYTH